MIQHLRRFTVDEAGAVTVEYVLLTAAFIALSITVVIPVATGTSQLAGNVSAEVAQYEPGSGSDGDTGAAGDDDQGDGDNEGGGATDSDCRGGPGRGNTGPGNPGKGNDKDVGNAGGC